MPVVGSKGKAKLGTRYITGDVEGKKGGEQEYEGSSGRRRKSKRRGKGGKGEEEKEEKEEQEGFVKRRWRKRTKHMEGKKQ